MRAAVLERHGGPEVLRVIDIDKPQPQIGEVLVEVAACGLNHGLDGRTRANGAGRAIQFPHVLGSEIAGRVVEVGAGVSDGWLGGKVLITPWQAEFSEAGEYLPQERHKPFLLRGIHFNGGNAEYVVAKPAGLISLPEDADLIEAAALPVSYSTAAHMLARAGLAERETVLVLGAAGTVGIAAIQLAKAGGARVIAAASSAAKRAAAQHLGADIVIDYGGSDWAVEVRALTGGRGVDVVIEHIGKETFSNSLASLAMGGRVAVCGASSGHQLEFDARPLWRKSASIVFVNSGSDSSLRRVVALWAEGKLKPVIANVFPLDDIAHAHEALSSRDIIGKVILQIKASNVRPE
jgi:2-desacetyl-2-hydroxyethyl bacteriochlorophyllide A dehydrogenase